jgi:hypothetical protein
MNNPTTSTETDTRYGFTADSFGGRMSREISIKNETGVSMADAYAAIDARNAARNA